MRRMRLLLFVVLAALAFPLPALANRESDDAGAAIAIVRATLARKGQPSDGPMVAAPMSQSPDGHRVDGWFVDADAGLFMVWSGNAVGPLTGYEADVVSTACDCNPDLVALPPGPNAPATRRTF